MSQSASPEKILVKLRTFLDTFAEQIQTEELRPKVLALLPVHNQLRKLGKALFDTPTGAARERILLYLRKYQGCVIEGDELMVVAGISEYARRVRELRVQFGWKIFSGYTVREVKEQEMQEGLGSNLPDMKPSQYLLVSPEQDLEAAYRWHVANSIRKQDGAVRDKLLQYFRSNVGKEITGEELRYVARNASEWARRVRELRTEGGWPIVTQTTGRPDLPVGVYILEEDRQVESHDRIIGDRVRNEVLVRDGFLCKKCGWSQKLWTKEDPRQLELHHIRPHASGGTNTADNLITLCNKCHDGMHRH